MKQSRWCSKAAWLSVISLVTFILKTYFNVEIPQVDTLVDLILILATTFGLFNDPTTKDAF